MLFALLILPGCTQKPEPIKYGSDECEMCRMSIVDKQYGAELISGKGKIYKFDSVECLVNYSLNNNMIGDKKNSLLVTDFSNPEMFIDVKKSFYVHNNNFRSPMGLNVSAFGTDASRKTFLNNKGGEEISWLELIELVKQNKM
jgi:copper chaperone NosL